MSCEESGAVTNYWASNETYLGPSFTLTRDCPPPEWLPLMILGGLFWLATLAVFLYTTRYFGSFRWTRTFICTMSGRILGYYVIYSLLNIMVIFNANGAAIYAYVGDCIEALCMVNFYHLIWSYTGGIEVTINKLVGLEINLGQPPCCCLRCAPNVKISKPFIRNLECLLLQLPAIQLVLGIVNLSLVQNGVSEQMFDHWATTLIKVILAISALLSIYAIGMLYACWSQFIVGRKVGSKFAVFKATIILKKTQEAILGLCTGAVQPYAYYGAKDRVAMWSAFIVTVECLVLCGIASTLYKPSDFDGPHSGIDQVKFKKDEIEIDGELERSLDEVDLGKPSLVIENPNI